MLKVSGLINMNCFDTYVLVEIEKGNTSYKHILSEPFVIPSAVLAEFSELLRSRQNEKTSKYWYKKLSPYTEDIFLEVWMKGFSYRRKHKKEKLSLIDALAYIFAQENNHVFVTGDKAFKNKKGVKFIPS